MAGLSEQGHVRRRRRKQNSYEN
uniref:Uncharacterized protein n=1 Tax=Arundo donax TaxID=35708 RepID=A0A0A8YII2_ARUDO